MKKLNCPNCGEHFDLTGASADSLGWHTNCPNCGCSFDIDIEDHLVPRGTKVITNDGVECIVDGNDEESTDEFEYINYYLCPIQYTHEKIWSNHYVMKQRDDFKIIG